MEVLEAICSYSDLDFCVAHVKAIHDPFTHISNDRNDTQSDQEDDEDDEGDNVDKNYFVAATQHLHQENELRVLLYDDATHSISDIARYDHSGEVICMEPHPRNPCMIATGYQDNGKSLASLWKMPLQNEKEAGDDHDEHGLHEVAAFAGQRGRTQQFSWSASGKLLNVTSLGVTVWDLHDNASRTDSIFQNEIAAPNYMVCGAFDPHNPEVFATGQAADISLMDLREKGKEHTFSIHAQSRAPGTKSFTTDNYVQQLSWNPNKPNTMAGGYDDGSIRIWDIRNTKQPVKVLAGHSHWVTSLQYNPYHDQLVMSTGTDAKSILWRASSVSSAPLIEMEEESDKRSASDLAVGVYYSHDQKKFNNSSWSCADAWTCALATNAGTVEIIQVPQKEKYKILF